MTTNAQLASEIHALMTKWNAREAEFRDWLAGGLTDGPNGDGRFPLTDASGRTILVPSLALLTDTVEGPAALSRTSQLLAEAARDVALGHRNQAADDAGSARLHKLAAQDARDVAQVYRDQAASHMVAAEVASRSAHVASFVIDGGSSASASLGLTPFAIDFGGAS